MVLKREDLMAGGLCVVLGGGFAIYALLSLKLGTPSRMGSGFFPVVLGGILVVLGLLIAFKPGGDGGAAVGGSEEQASPVPWRAIIALTIAPILFAATVRSLGLVLSTALCVAVVCFASRRMTIRMGAGVTVGLTALCVLVFSYGLHLPLPLFPSFIAG
jgi:hypothetical protein